jgi:hypothetical protein
MPWKAATGLVGEREDGGVCPRVRWEWAACRIGEAAPPAAHDEVLRRHDGVRRHAGKGKGRAGSDNVLGPRASSSTRSSHARPERSPSLVAAALRLSGLVATCLPCTPPLLS